MPRALSLILILIASVSASYAAEPWEFANRDEQEVAKRTYRESYYYVQYQKSVQILDSKKNVDEAIVRLKLAIDDHPSSGIVQLPGRQTLEYYPYYYLTVAYAEKGRYPDAEACRVRESAQIRKSNLKSAFETISRLIPLLANRDMLLSHAGTVLGWGGGQGGVVLSSDGRTALGNIESLSPKCRAAAQGDVEEVCGRLRTVIVELTGGEVRKLAELLSRLAGERWSGAFASERQLVDPSSCQVPGGSGGNEVALGIETLTGCSEKITRAMRTAGRWECASLSDLRSNIGVLSGRLSAWMKGQGSGPLEPPTIAALPSSCIEWEKASPARLAEAFVSLESEVPGVRQALVQQQSRITADLKERSAAILARVAGLGNQLPDISRECAGILQLGEVATRVRSLRSKLSVGKLGAGEAPDPQIFEAESLVSGALNDLAVRVREGVTQLQQSGNCPGIPEDSLGALPGARDGYLDGRSQAEFRTLCTMAGRAESDIQNCWSKNIAAVQADVDRSINLFDAAGVTTLASDEELSCLQVTLDGLRRAKAGSTRDKGAWVKQARSSLSAAQVCLKDFNQATKDERVAILSRLREVREMFDSLSGLVAPDGGVDTLADSLRGLGRLIEGMRTEAESMSSRLEMLAPLYEGDQALEAAKLRATLESAGFDAAVPARVWSVLDAARSDDARQGSDALLLVRDAAVYGELKSDKRTIDDWQPTIVKLGPSAALNRSFAAFVRGDLDGSILVLREAQAQEHFPARGREAAMAHTAMAFFLHAKALALSRMGADDDVRESLTRDVRRELRLAVGADEAFSLPESLFPNSIFRKEFEAYARAETRQEG